MKQSKKNNKQSKKNNRKKRLTRKIKGGNDRRIMELLTHFKHNMKKYTKSHQFTPEYIKFFIKHNLFPSNLPLVIIMKTFLEESVYAGSIDVEEKKGQCFGQVVEGVPHGLGICIWGRNTKKYNAINVYTGDFYKGVITGYGKVTRYEKNLKPISFEVETYEGNFKAADEDGKGVKHYSNGDIYDGDWIEGKKHGKGTMNYSDGESYNGDWEHNTRTGKGTMRYRNDTYVGEYVGDFKNGDRDGLGKMTYDSGTIEEGQWVEDQFVDTESDKMQTGEDSPFDQNL